MLWQPLQMPTLNPVFLAHFQKPSIWSRNHLLSFLLVCWMSLCLYDFSFILFPLIPTALLICLENTFWNPTVRDGNFNFVGLFKKSFALYVESGMWMKMEAAIDIMRNEQGGCLVTKEEFFKFIIEHYLRKFHCFYFHLTYLTSKCSPLLGLYIWARTKEWNLAEKVDAKNP